MRSRCRGIDSVRQGKVFDIEVADGTDAEAALKDACEKLLANTIVENYPRRAAARIMKAAVVLFPGSNREGDAVRALRAAGIDAEVVWHGEHDLPAAPISPCCPAASPTAITCAAAPLPGARR